MRSPSPPITGAGSREHWTSAFILAGKALAAVQVAHSVEPEKLTFSKFSYLIFWNYGVSNVVHELGLFLCVFFFFFFLFFFFFSLGR